MTAVRHTLFLADLHLCSTRPQATATFTDLFSALPDHVDAVYLLGDLFEFWHGDDDRSDTHKRIIEAIRSVTAHNIPFYFQKGNRDFLVSEQFCAETGMTLLPDYHVIDLYGENILVMHGDLLCTDDTAYQRMRNVFNLGILQTLYTSMPLDWRYAISKRVRRASIQQNRQKAEQIMDVNETTVRETMQRYSVKTLIHGHTHRPAMHAFEMDQVTANRVVLGDWYQDSSLLVCTENERRLVSVVEYKAAMAD